MYECHECGAGTPDSHKTTCSLFGGRSWSEAISRKAAEARLVSGPVDRFEIELMEPLNLEAIEGADHMTITPEEHDPDGWFRHTILQLTNRVREVEADHMQTAREWHDDELKLERVINRLEEILETEREWLNGDDPVAPPALRIAEIRLGLAQELLKELQA